MRRFCLFKIINNAVSTLQKKKKNSLQEYIQEIGRYQSRYLVKTFIFINGVSIIMYLKSYSFVESFDLK